MAIVLQIKKFFCIVQTIEYLLKIMKQRNQRGFLKRKKYSMQQWVFQLLSGPAPYLFTCVHLQGRSLALAAASDGEQNDVGAANDILHHHSTVYTQLYAVTIIRDTGSKLFRNIGKSLTLSPCTLLVPVSDHTLPILRFLLCNAKGLDRLTCSPG